MIVICSKHYPPWLSRVGIPPRPDRRHIWITRHISQLLFWLFVCVLLGVKSWTTALVCHHLCSPQPSTSLGCLVFLTMSWIVHDSPQYLPSAPCLLLSEVTVSFCSPFLQTWCPKSLQTRPQHSFQKNLGLSLEEIWVLVFREHSSAISMPSEGCSSESDLLGIHRTEHQGKHHQP